MTAGTPAPQDAETGLVAQAIADEFYGMQGGDPSWPEAPEFNEGDYALASAVLSALAPVRASEVEAARREGAREALVAAAQAAVTEDQGIPWDHDYDRATVAAWLSERADEVTRSDTADHERTNGQGG